MSEDIDKDKLLVILHEIRTILKVPEGVSTIEHANKIMEGRQ